MLEKSTGIGRFGGLEDYYPIYIMFFTFYFFLFSSDNYPTLQRVIKNVKNQYVMLLDRRFLMVHNRPDLPRLGLEVVA